MEKQLTLAAVPPLHHCTTHLTSPHSASVTHSLPHLLTRAQETICEITFPSTVLNVKLNRERVVICLESHIHVYALATMKCLQILSTAHNPTGLLALSGESSSYLVFPTGTDSLTHSQGGGGGVVLYDCVSLRLLSQIDAHKKTLMAMEFNRWVNE
jgi:autophagy-related protein 18